MVPHELLPLVRAELLQDQLQPLGAQGALLVQVALTARQNAPVDVEQELQCALVNVQTWQVGQEVVAHEQMEQNIVVDDLLQVKRKRKLVPQVVELHLEVFAHKRKVQQVERLALDGRRAPVPLRPEQHLLTQQGKVWVMAQQAEHDQVRVQAVETVARVGVVPRLRTHGADELHDLVLALTRHVVAREDHLHVAPVGVLRDLLGNEVVQVHRHALHERGARRDAVRVERRRLGDLLTPLDRLLERLLGLLRRAETPAPLLVHLGSRRHTIHGEEEHLLGLDFGKQMFDVREYAQHDLLLRDPEGRLLIPRVRTAGSADAAGRMRHTSCG